MKRNSSLIVCCKKLCFARQTGLKRVRRQRENLALIFKMFLHHSKWHFKNLWDKAILSARKASWRKSISRFSIDDLKLLLLKGIRKAFKVKSFYLQASGKQTSLKEIKFGRSSIPRFNQFLTIQRAVELLADRNCISRKIWIYYLLKSQITWP